MKPAVNCLHWNRKLLRDFIFYSVIRVEVEKWKEYSLILPSPNLMRMEKSLTLIIRDVLKNMIVTLQSPAAFHSNWKELSAFTCDLFNQFSLHFYGNQRCFQDFLELFWVIGDKKQGKQLVRPLDSMLSNITHEKKSFNGNVRSTSLS